MAEYIVTERIPGTFTVTKFGDYDIPEHVATVILAKKKVDLGFYRPATPKVVEKYLDFVRQYLKDNKPHCMIYKVTEDLCGDFIITGNSYQYQA